MAEGTADHPPEHRRSRRFPVVIPVEVKWQEPSGKTLTARRLTLLSPVWLWLRHCNLRSAAPNMSCNISAATPIA